MSINTTASRYRIIRRFRLRGVEFPIADVIRPVALAGETNGKLPAAKMSTFPLAQGGTGKVLAGATARSWLALMWIAKVIYGAQLTATSSGDTYRDYAGQERGWLRRNTLTHLPLRPSRMCGYGGVKRRWWLKPGMAGIACPGTSNHGWAQAIDHGIYVVTSILKRGKVDRPVAWLKWFVPVAQSFGWSWEAPTEDWHVRYVLGDLVPQAVLDVELAHAKPVLQVGSKGGDVVAWQQFLGGLRIDGDFGPKTKARVVVWQQGQRGWYGGKGLPADGIIDVDDWYALAHPTMAVA